MKMKTHMLIFNYFSISMLVVDRIKKKMRYLYKIKIIIKKR